MNGKPLPPELLSAKHNAEMAVLTGSMTARANRAVEDLYAQALGVTKNRGNAVVLMVRILAVAMLTRVVWLADNGKQSEGVRFVEDLFGKSCKETLAALREMARGEGR